MREKKSLKKKKKGICLGLLGVSKGLRVGPNNRLIFMEEAQD